MENEKREIYLTGETVEEYGEKTEPRCYLCKRCNNSTSLFLEDFEEGISKEMVLHWYKVEVGGISINYPLCLECFNLIDSFREIVEKLFMQQTFMIKKHGLN